MRYRPGVALTTALLVLAAASGPRRCPPGNPAMSSPAHTRHCWPRLRTSAPRKPTTPNSQSSSREPSPQTNSPIGLELKTFSPMEARRRLGDLDRARRTGRRSIRRPHPRLPQAAKANTLRLTGATGIAGRPARRRRRRRANPQLSAPRMAYPVLPQDVPRHGLTPQDC